MLTATLAILALSAPAMGTVELYPTDDVWAYPHASDQDNDPFLRIWGFEGESVAKSADESESFGYSLLKFDVKGLPSKPLKGATLVLTHTAKPPFTAGMAKQSPIEVRPVNAEFSEKDWAYVNLSRFMPKQGKDQAFGLSTLDAADLEKEFTIRVNLLAGPGSFAKALEAAKEKGALALALTTALAPNEEARSIYKVYSRNGPEASRPVLKLEFED